MQVFVRIKHDFGQRSLLLFCWRCFELTDGGVWKSDDVIPIVENKIVVIVVVVVAADAAAVDDV